MWSINKNLSGWGIALFAFIVCGVYTFSFNGARQGMACAVCSLAIRPLLERRVWRYILIVLIASLFHKSALIAAPAYYLIQSNSHRWHFVHGRSADSIMPYAILGVGAMLALLLFRLGGSNLGKWIGVVMPVGGQRYESYFVYGGSEAGRIVTIIDVGVCLFFLWQRRFVLEKRDLYESSLRMFVIGNAIAVISAIEGLNPSGIRRFSAFFSYSIIFLWPLVFANMKRSPERLFCGLAFVIGYCAYYGVMLVKFSNLVPYVLNQTLIP
jgi:hypothetical protein